MIGKKTQAEPSSMEVATIQLFGPFSIVRSAASDAAHRAVEEELQQKVREMKAKAKEEEKFQVGFFGWGFGRNLLDG